MTTAFIPSLIFADQLLTEHFGSQYANLSAPVRGALCGHFAEQPLVPFLREHSGSDLRDLALGLLVDAVSGLRPVGVEQ